MSIKGFTSRLLMHLSRRGFLNWVSDELYIKTIFYLKFGYRLNLNNPQTFNEKLQWLKLYCRTPELTTMVDKYRVRDYIKNTIGEEYLIPLIGKWNHPNDIDFSKLPKQFVLKCNHDSGGLVICKDKESLDIKKSIKKLAYAFKNNGYRYGREWPYKDVPRCVIAEKYMEDSTGKGQLTDYKLHFFSGECKAVMVGKNRYGTQGLENDFYTPEWEHFDFTRGHSHNSPERSPKPQQLSEMLKLGRILAKDYPFVRVDFYVIDNKVYFGEITFYPASGFKPFHPEKWDRVFGDWIKLPI